MKHLVRPTMIVTVFVLGSQMVAFVTQIVIAGAFGARADMDAFLAANTLPQYLITVLLSALGFVLIPVFVDYASVPDHGEAWEIVNAILSLCALVLGVLALAGIFFARPILHWTTPGLSASSLDLAVKVSMFTWPTLVVTGLISLLTGVYQALHRFSWSSAVPVLGALLNLALVEALARPFGVIGVAAAATAGLVLQMILLAPVVARSGHFRISFNYGHAGVRQVLHLLWPLLISSLLIRWTPIIDRYLASGLQEGTISHLSYAFKLLTLSTMVLSTGITTVVFPRMALNIATSNLSGLGQTVSTGLRLMWVVIAPSVTLGAVLSVQIVTLLFVRGRFTHADAAEVGGLLRIYLLSMIAGGLGNITGRAFYALKETRLIAILGVLEASAYAVYTPLLARRFGASGVALGYVLYFNLSLLWQFPVLRYKMGNHGGTKIFLSFCRTTIAALAGALPAWILVSAFPDPLSGVFAGLAGLVIYGVVLLAVGSPEAQLVRVLGTGWISAARRWRAFDN
jgi:putative peptidoglycan lipid II flippase